MIVVDTNILAYFFLSTDRSEKAEQLFRVSPDWHAPLLWRSEFRSVLSQYMRKNIIDLSDANSIMQEAERLMTGKEYGVASHQILSLIDKSGCSAYDCEYVALAKHLMVPFITEDRKLAQYFPSIAVTMDGYLS